MKVIKANKVWYYTTAFAILTPLIFVTFTGHFPYLGVGIVLILLNLLVFFTKGNRTKLDTLLVTLGLILSSFVFLRSAEFITFINILAVFILGAILALPTKLQQNLGFIDIFMAPVMAVYESLSRNNPYKPGKLNYKNKARGRFYEIAFSILVSVILILLIVPLLASVNPIFKSLVEDLIPNLTWFEEIRFGEWLIRIIFSILFYIFLPRLIARANSLAEAKENLPELKNLSLIIPKIAVTIVLMIFFVTQIQFYMASETFLTEMGYTLSKHAREVFGQLTIVAGIVLALVYNDKKRGSAHKMLTLILLIQGVFLALMALSSVYAYSSAWGFTHKRLWGYTGVFYVLGVIGLFVYKYFVNLKDSDFVKQILVFSAVALIWVNVANFDYLIFNYKKAATEQGIDYAYLVRLSADCQCFDELLIQINSENILKDPDNNYPNLNYSLYEIEHKVDRLNTKYSNLDIRTFNISEYRQFLQQ